MKLKVLLAVALLVAPVSQLLIKNTQSTWDALDKRELMNWIFQNLHD
ncbi:hypothetical protein [Winogradskyella aurantiaca]|nr:hypothetical protein [Winogradskyella aurantiaca]